MPPVAELLPHRGRMVLLDRLERLDENGCVAVAALRPTHPFADDQANVPAYVGLEYIVQAVAAFVGFPRWQQGFDPLVGLVLGTRSCHIRHSVLPGGQQLRVAVRRVWLEAPLGVFDGEVSVQGETYVTGQVKAIQPRTDTELAALLEPLH